MSLPIHVEAYSGYKANERPLSFSVDIATGKNDVTGVYDIEAVEDRWYDPNGEYFKVRAVEGKRYILRYAEHEDEWTLQSGFDGAELLARPGIELVSVEPSAIRRADPKSPVVNDAAVTKRIIRSTAFLRTCKHGAF